MQHPKNSNNEWDVPDWFKELIVFGIKLGSMTTPNSKLSHLLMAVPRAEPAAFALGAGFSIATFLKGSTQAEEVDLEDLSVGELVQMRTAWSFQNKTHKWLSPKNTVGHLAELVTSPDGSRRTIRLETDGFTTKPTPIMSHRSPRGRKLPDEHIRFFRVPEGTPRRVAESPLEIEMSDVDFSKWEGWEYQINPTLAVFGNSTTIAEVSKLMVRPSSLLPSLPEIPDETLWSIARFDQLANDVRPHFVNSYDQIGSYPLSGTREYRTLQRFPFVCFSGNAAIRNLVDEDGLNGKTVIGLWEQGNGTLQDESLSMFKGEADTGSPIENLEKYLGFTIPSLFPMAAWRPNV